MAKVVEQHENPTLAMTIIVTLWTGLLLLLPPSVVKFSNPPPTDLVLFWWLRFLTALGLLLFNSYALFIYKGKKNIGQALLHYASSGFALLIGAMLMLWVFEFPYPFGLSPSIRTWWGH